MKAGTITAIALLLCAIAASVTADDHYDDLPSLNEEVDKYGLFGTLRPYSVCVRLWRDERMIKYLGDPELEFQVYKGIRCFEDKIKEQIRDYQPQFEGEQFTDDFTHCLEFKDTKSKHHCYFGTFRELVEEHKKELRQHEERYGRWSLETQVDGMTDIEVSIAYLIAEPRPSDPLGDGESLQLACAKAPSGTGAWNVKLYLGATMVATELRNRVGRVAIIATRFGHEQPEHTSWRVPGTGREGLSFAGSVSDRKDFVTKLEGHDRLLFRTSSGTDIEFDIRKSRAAIAPLRERCVNDFTNS